MKYVLKALKSIFDLAFPFLGFYLKGQIEQMCQGYLFSVVLRAKREKHKCPIIKAFIK